MDITFLIGNGFDINLGLNTTYADFVNHYKTTEVGSMVLAKFRNHINDNEELWKNAEIALGQYTQEFETGNGLDFSECHEDMCEQLVKYLKEQEARLKYDSLTEKVLSAFKKIDKPESPFPTIERNIIRGIFNKYGNQEYLFNFICFNYTETLDKCLGIVKESSGLLGQHRYGNVVFGHKIKDLCHVHGTVDKDIVFAVNDETQIAKPDIFNFEDGEICRRLLIKQQANELYQEDKDSIANRILQNSTIIYIYGMSLGATDTLWWNRICKWLLANGDRHLIIQNHAMLHKGVYQMKYLMAEKKKKKELLSFSNFDDNTKNALLQRIHVTGYNIFSDISDVATDMPAETLSTGNDDLGHKEAV